MGRKRAEYKSSIASKRQIKKSFAELLYQQPLNKITVTAVIEKAGISRSTFYAHYSDIDDLLAAIEKEETDKIFSLIEQADAQKTHPDPKPLLQEIASYIDADKEYYKTLFLSDKSGNFLVTVKTMLTEKMLSNPKIQQYRAKAESELRIYFSFFISALLSVTVDWFLDELKISREELIDTVSAIINNGLSANHLLAAPAEA